MSEPASRPTFQVFRPDPGVEIEHRGRHCVVVAAVALAEVLIEDLETKERWRARLAELRVWTGPPEQQRDIPDLALLSAERQAIGKRRKEAIDTLLAMDRRTRATVQVFAKDLGLAVSSMYALINRYRREGSLTCLIPHAEKGRPRKSRLRSEVDAIVEAAIDEFYMAPKRERPQHVVTMVEGRCRTAGMKPPSPTTIRARIAARDPHSVITAREGPKVALDRLGPVYGAGAELLWPLQRVQIDHTVADMFVVDSDHRLSATRPILTLVIDEFSRCVVGFCLRLAAPSTLSVALALHHAILPKDDYCRRMGTETGWDVCGVPDWIFTDNAAEFDSKGLQLGCEQWGINGIFRPLGAPHFGGRIERLIGTMMGELRLVPGATMNSIAERGKDYDPEKHAAYTIEEAERRIAIMIADVYHRKVHSATGVPPIKLFEFGIFGDDRTPGRGLPRLPSNPERLLIDFLPAKERTVQDYGIQYDYIRYQAPVLRTLRDDKKVRTVIVRRNPDDVSRIYFYHPDDGEHYDIPYANSYRPAVALWEVKAAIARLKADGRSPDDENAIFRTIERLRAMDAETAATSKRARKNQERRREAARSPLSSPAGPAGEADRAAPETAADAQTDPPVVSSQRVKPIADLEGW